jgi:hypothetical protein
MNRNDDKYLSDLRDQHERAELEILTASPDSLPTLFDSGALTVGQMIIVCELINGMRDVVNGAKADSARERATGLLAKYAEKRYGAQAAQYGTVSSPFGLADTDDEPTEEQKAEAVRRLKELIKARFGLDSDTNMVDTVNGPVPMSSIPRDEEGNFDQAWINENCNCEDHTDKRVAQAERAAELSRGGFREEHPSENDERTGLYV